MLHLLIVAYAQFVTRVMVQQSVNWLIVHRRGFQEVEAPRYPDILAHEVVQVVSPKRWPLLSPQVFDLAHNFQEQKRGVR
jgi:hypothetical protein